MKRRDLETLDFETIVSVGIYKVWRMSAKTIVLFNTETQKSNYVTDLEVAAEFLTAKAGA